ncbi:SDR family oxidoreductase [Skermania piniformis]|uniref:3-dehydrosphinganine reductase n=1 Tax=Skermania pinensis TaxID=39122 RepID=A0ABX8S3N0_9ACTN|nr:SDR family oxidoreductase [Skermania piniformis]QXQ12404.1 SDR family oxidoreductase [Skermania piniformis]
MRNWPGARVLITGGSSGIGLATARLLTGRGASVVIAARRADVLHSAAQELGPSVRTAVVDVTDRARVRGVVDELTEHGSSPFDVVVMSAGDARPGHFMDLDHDVFRSMMEVNYFGTLNTIQATVPAMLERRSGSIVAVSSVAGILGVFGYTAYSPAKFAVRGLMQSLRDELTPHGIHVGCVFPPDVDTPMLLQEARFKPAETAALSGTIRPLPPEQVARAVVRGIERRRFAIYPDRSTGLLAATSAPLAPIFRAYFDRQIARARRT